MAKIVAPKSVQPESAENQIVETNEKVEQAQSTNTEIPEENPVESTENKVENTEKPTEWMSEAMKAILERLERLEKENEELKKGDINVVLDWRKIYDWPRAYSYKLWWGVPVLSYKSFKKDPTKDLIFKDQFNQYKSNHYLKLTLADWNEVEVEVNEFNRDYERSDKMLAEKCTDNRWNLLWYEFDTPQWWKIIVSENMIN